MSDSQPVPERLAKIEADIAHLLDESRAIRTTLHSLLTTAINDHSAAIRALSAAHEQKVGVWWTIAWVGGALFVGAGLVAWLLEHNIQIVIKP